MKDEILNLSAGDLESENMSNDSDEGHNHNTKIDEQLCTIDASNEMRRNFGNAISSIKGVS